MSTPNVVRAAITACPDVALRDSALITFDRFIAEHSDRGLTINQLTRERDDALAVKASRREEEIARGTTAARQAIPDLARHSAALTAALSAATAMLAEKPP